MRLWDDQQEYYKAREFEMRVSRFSISRWESYKGRPQANFNIYITLLTSFQAINHKQYGSWNESLNWEDYGGMIDTGIESKIKGIIKYWTDIPTNFHHMPTTSTWNTCSDKNQTPIFRFAQKRCWNNNIRRLWTGYECINEGDSGRVYKKMMIVIWW